MRRVLAKNKMNIPGTGEIAREFYNELIFEALRECQKKHEALYMPEIVDIRNKLPKETRIWETWWTSPSLRATGRTKQGNAVVIYAHIPNHFSSPENIEEAIEKNLINYAGIIPNKEFERLLELEDNKRVFVVDYNKMANSSHGLICLSNALKHPQVIPFFGGSKRAETYIEKHKEYYGEKIRIWHTNDLGEKPLGRPLFLGYKQSFGLGGDGILNCDGHFLGTPKNL